MIKELNPSVSEEELNQIKVSSLKLDFANIEEDGIKEKEFSQLLKSEPIYTLNQFKNY